MSLFLGIGISLLVVLVVGLIYLSKTRANTATQRQTSETLVEWIKSFQQSTDQRLQGNEQALGKLTQSLTTLLQTNAQNTSAVLQANTQALNQRLDKTAGFISEVAREVGQMSEIGRSMRELQEFLKSPKLRGNIGEEVLKDLVGQIFPKGSYFLQYSFQSGEKVDVAIKTGAGILPIDAKFPMENFQKMAKAEDKRTIAEARGLFVRDVRLHVRAISKKYIMPGEGTVDFALMYIPSEAVYYEIVGEPSIIDYARGLRIYPVSPSTLYAALQTILLSFEGQKIEARTKEAFRMMRALGHDFQKLDASLGILGKHLGNAYSKMGEVNQNAAQIGQKLQSARSLNGTETEKIPEKVE